MAEAVKRPLVHVSAAIFEGNRILLVQETKPDVHGRWNFPGGHVELDEPIPAAATREVREETGLSVEMLWLVGIYITSTSIRFVLGTDGGHAGAHPGDDIMACRSVSLADVAAIADSELHSPKLTRRIVADLQAGRRYPLDLFAHMGH